ncbi:MAG: shikimate dehydrogenase [Lewinella sp.]|nr:shikimate dehydrogenase [Lewinella sp.]
MTYGLIGYPLSHSFSQPYFTEKFARLGLSNTHQYLNFPLASLTEFPSLLRRYPDLRGLNVTLPHKTNIVSYLDELDPLAAAVGAVNTIVVGQDGQTKGYNTDVLGFQTDVQEFIMSGIGEPKEHKAMVLGVSGGAALAVTYALQQMKIAYLGVSRLAGPQAVIYEDIRASVLADYTLIINATPLGMFPNVDAAPHLPYRAFGHQHFAYDLVYNPAVSLFLRLAGQRGAATRNGLGMLHGQAEAAWDIWTAEGN